MSDLPAPPQRRRRPRFLLIALLVAWILATGGVMNGCSTLQYYRQSTLPTLELAEDVDPISKHYISATFEARTKAYEGHRDRLVPLAAGNLVFSALLLIACARALGGRSGAGNLAFQAILANIAFAVVDYALSSPVRRALESAVASGPYGLLMQTLVVWSARLSLVLQLAALALVAYALTRQAAKTYFQPDRSHAD